MIATVVQGRDAGREEKDQPEWAVHSRRGTECARDEGHGDFGFGRTMAPTLSFSWTELGALCP